MVMIEKPPFRKLSASLAPVRFDLSEASELWKMAKEYQEEAAKLGGGRKLISATCRRRSKTAR
jgi:hypothetical protein